MIKVVLFYKKDKTITTEGITDLIDVFKLIAFPYPRIWSYTVNLFLPFARLLLMTLLPPLLLILSRNPWVLFLFLLWG